MIFPYETVEWENGCIAGVHPKHGIWINPAEYLPMRFEKEQWSGSRLSYHLNCEKIGKSPPASMKGPFVLHRCHKKWCINSEHLYLGTPKQNKIDMMEDRGDIYRENMRRIVTDLWKDESYSSSMADKKKGVKWSEERKAARPKYSHTDEAKARISAAQKIIQADEGRKQRQREVSNKRWAKPGEKERQAERSNKRWAKPGEKERQKEKVRKTREDRAKEKAGIK